MQIIKGDLFANLKNHGKCVVPHIVNNEGVMGGGFVIPLQKHFPKAKEEYIKWHKYGTNHSKYKMFQLGQTQYVKVNDGVVIANMLSQVLGTYNNTPPIRYAALSRCMESVRDYAKARDLEIVAPMFGAGRAGGNWEYITTLINEVWDMSGLNVTIYQL